MSERVGALARVFVAALLAVVWSGEARAGWSEDLASGDCVSAVAALKPEAIHSDLERLAKGRCMQELGQSGGALEVLAPIRTAGLLPYAALVRGRALLEVGKAAEAAVALRGATGAGAGEETALLTGRALVQAGRSLEARDGLRALLEGQYGAEARYWLAMGALDRQEVPLAIGTFQAVWTKHPTSPWSEAAERKLGELGVRLPDYGSEAGRGLAMARAQTLLSMHLADRAVPLLDGVHAQAPFSAPEEQRAFAAALFDARLYGRAVEWYGRAVASGLQPGASVSFEIALATARAGDYPGAARLYEALIARFPGTPQADEALYKLPYMRFDAKDWGGAISGFETYLARQGAAGKFIVDARWFRAWSIYKLRGAQAGVEAFAEVERLGGSAERAQAARYWRARLTGDSGELRRIATSRLDGSAGAYAWFARARLGMADPAMRAMPVRPSFPAGFVEARPDLATALLLLSGGMPDWARPLLRAHVGAAQAMGGEAGKQASMAMAWLLLDAEDFQGAQRLAAPWCSSGEPVAMVACFPRPHHSTVQQIAATYGLEPLLPYAIMNAESGLDPSVTSPAGARGLMQLMPELAKKLAAEEPGAIPGFQIGWLYRAGLNARLGTKELGLLSRRFARGALQPALPLVIASYNGGADAVDRWLGTYPDVPDIDLFCEEISYTETRRYVRRVLGFLMQYRAAYSG